MASVSSVVYLIRDNLFMQHVDCLIIGGGIAGTTLAWQLRWRGLSVLVVDRGEPATASRIAAGLVTPLTGKRLAVSERFAELWPMAEQFYRRVEQKTSQSLLATEPALRLLMNDAERDAWQNRRDQPGVSKLARDATPAELGPWQGRYPGVLFSEAAKLNVPAYLSASREVFASKGCYQQSVLTVGDLSEVDDVFQWEVGGVTAQSVALCRGVGASEWESLPLEAAKGEILTIRVRGIAIDRVVHGAGIWIAPLGDSLLRVGATFDRDNLNTQPTTAGRQWLIERVQQLVSGPIEVVEQTAAIRPIVAGRRPVAKWLTDRPNVAVLNGLGAKGVLWAPWLANELAIELSANHQATQARRASE